MRFIECHLNIPAIAASYDKKQYNIHDKTILL